MRSKHSLLVKVLAGTFLFILAPGCSPEAKKARHLERADALFESRSLDGAEIEYLNVLRIEPRDPHAVGQLGRIFLAQGRTLRALETLNAAVQLQPEDAELRVQLGRATVAAGRAGEARQLAREVLENHPENDEAILLFAEASVDPAQAGETREFLAGLSPDPSQRGALQLAFGLLSMRLRNTDDAEAHFQRALELDPNSATAYSAMGTLHRFRNQVQQADESMHKAFELAPPRSPLRLQYARFKMQTGDSAAAENLLEQMTRETPDYLPAWMSLAEIAFVEERDDDCETALKRILSREHMHPDALLLSGRLYARMGRNDQAAASLQRLLDRFPRSTAALFHLARVEVARGDATKAIAALQQAVQIDPNLADAVLLLARIHMDRGDYAQAANGLRAHVSNHPNDARAQLLLADTHVRQNQPAQALAIYRELEQRLPDNPQVSFLAGMMLLQQKMPEQARQAFEEALSRSEGYYPPLEQLVGLDLARGNRADAHERVAARVAAEPDRPEFRFLLARVLIAEEATERAIDELLDTVRQWPEFRPAQIMLAQLYSQSNREQEALQQLEATLAKNPGDAGALTLIGAIHDQLGNHQKSRDAYERLLEIAPNNHVALNNLAVLYSEHLNEPERAYELARKARTNRPDEPYTADTLGWILVQRGELPLATNLLQESARMLPDSAEVAYHLGVALYLAGNEIESRSELQRALDLNAEFRGAPDARERLSILEINPASPDSGNKERLTSRLDERPDDTIALLRLAAVHAFDGNPTAARDAYQTLLAARPGNVRALLGLARIHAWELGEIPAALKFAQAAHELAPDDPQVAATLAEIVLQSGDHERAANLLRTIVHRGAASAETHRALAWAEFGLGRLEEAQSAMQTALSATPPLANPDVARRFLETLAQAQAAAYGVSAPVVPEATSPEDPIFGPSLWLRAVAAERGRDAAAEIDAYEQLLREFPRFFPAMVNLAELYARSSSQLEVAYDLASSARTIRPSDARCARILGRIELLRGNHARAITLLEESRSRLPDTAAVLHDLGMATYHLRGPDAALEPLRQALELGLPEDDAANVRALLSGATAP